MTTEDRRSHSRVYGRRFFVVIFPRTQGWGVVGKRDNVVESNKTSPVNGEDFNGKKKKESVSDKQKWQSPARGASVTGTDSRGSCPGPRV